MICGRDADSLTQAAADGERTTGGRWRRSADLSQLAEVERVAKVAATRLGRIDILVNNAGAIKGGDFLAEPDDEWLGGWSLKLFGYIRMARDVLPHMQRQSSGRIVNVVGAAARNPSSTYMTGGMANAALINFTKALSDLGREVERAGDRVSPGPVNTERWESLMLQQAKAAGQVSETTYKKEVRNFHSDASRARGSCRPGLLPRVRARLVSHRHYRDRGRRHHPRSLSLRKFCCSGWPDPVRA